jgi:uncharacterized protein YbbC (DUF1343 family)
MSYVGAFRVPYVHGLTMGELATLAKNTLASSLSPSPSAPRASSPSSR